MTDPERVRSEEMESGDMDRRLRELEETLDRRDRADRLDDGLHDATAPPTPLPVSPTPPPPPPPPMRAPISPPPHPPPPPKKGSSKGFFSYIILVLLLITIIGVILALILGGSDLPGLYSTGDQIAVIYVQGVMITGGLPDGFGFATSESICKNIRLATDDNSVKAIVLRANSPGGSPAAAQEIAHEIKKAKSEKPVVVSMGDVAASAAYYISAPTDWIIANPDTITGSIGVIWIFENKSGYYDEEGIEHWVAKSGEFKDMGGDWRNLTEKEKIYAEEVVMDAFSRFVDEVAAGRNMSREQVLNLSDGRVYTGADAIDLGLVDEVGNMYDAIDIAAELGNCTGEPEIKYMNKPSLSQLLFGGAERGYAGLGISDRLVASADA